MSSTPNRGGVFFHTLPLLLSSKFKGIFSRLVAVAELLGAITAISWRTASSATAYHGRNLDRGRIDGRRKTLCGPKIVSVPSAPGGVNRCAFLACPLACRFMAHRGHSASLPRCPLIIHSRRHHHLQRLFETEDVDGINPHGLIRCPIVRAGRELAGRSSGLFTGTLCPDSALPPAQCRQ